MAVHTTKKDLEEMNAEERYALYQKQLVAAQAELGELDSHDKEANEALNRKRMEQEEEQRRLEEETNRKI